MPGSGHPRLGETRASTVWLARNNDDPPTDRNLHLRRLGEIYTSMKQAGVVGASFCRGPASGEPRLRAANDLPDDSALNQPLPFALAALELLDLGLLTSPPTSSRSSSRS